MTINRKSCLLRFFTQHEKQAQPRGAAPPAPRMRLQSRGSRKSCRRSKRRQARRASAVP